MSSAQTQFSNLLITKLTNANIVKQVALGRINSVHFEDVPAILLWHDYIQFRESITSMGPNIVNGYLVTQEYPVYGVCIFGNTEQEADDTFETAKQVIGGYMPVLTGATLMSPLIPIISASPFQLDKLFCVGAFFSARWDVKHVITN